VFFFEHRGNEEVCLNLPEVERLVDVGFPLRTADSVLARLREIEFLALLRTQAGDHILVVRKRDLDLDTCFSRELLLDLVRHIADPGKDPELLRGERAACGQERAE
jgi:hypothetical protein